MALPFTTNPGIGGLEELTSSEEAIIASIAALGTAGYVLAVNATEDGVEWIAVGAGSGHTIQDEGTPLTTRANLNFVGAGVTVTDDSGNNATVVTISGGGGGGTPGGSDTQVQFNDGGVFAGDAGLTYNKTTNELTAGSFSGGASALTSLNINGAAGSGHIHLKHQSSDPSSQASSSTIFADSNGNLAWINNGLSKITLDGDGVTAARVYTLPDATGTLALTSDLHAAVTVTDSTSIDFTLTGQDITAQREALTGAITAPKNSNTTSLGSFTKAQLDAAVSDGNVLYVGDISQYTDELAQDAVGAMAANSTFISLTYVDGTPSLTAALSATGTPSSSTYLRGDNTWATVTGGNTFNDIYIDQSGGTSDTYGVLAGTINSSNTLFTVSESSYASGTLKVWLNGQLMTQGTGEDFVETTPASGTFTFNTAPATGSLITVEYQKVVTNSDTIVTTLTIAELAQDAIGAMVDSTLVYTDGTPLLSRAALTGHVVASAGSNALTLGSFTKAQLDTAVSDGNVLYVGDITQYTDELAQDAVGTILTDSSTIDFTYNDAGNTITAIVIDGSISNAKLANMAASTFKGRITGSTGVPEDLTGTQATTLLDVFTSALKGLAPASGGGTTNFLRADGTWAAPPGGGGISDGDKGDITVSGSGATWTIDNGVITFAKMQAITDGVLLGASGGTAVEEITIGSGLSLVANVLSATGGGGGLTQGQAVALFTGYAMV